MEIRALLIVLVISCGGERHPTAEGVYKVYAQDKSWISLRSAFAEKYAWVPNLLQGGHDTELNVYWSDTTCPYDPGRNAIVLDNGRCVHGVMYGCDEIYVALNQSNPTRTCGTALVHEYGHCMRMLAGWGADGDHSADEFWNWIQEKGREQCDRGW